MSFLKQAHIFFILCVLTWTSIAQDVAPAFNGSVLDIPENVLISEMSEEQISEEMVANVLAFHIDQCMDATGAIPYNKTVDIKDENGKVVEKINCAETAALQYQLFTESGMTEQEAIACTTQGWHAEDRLMFVKELGLKVEEVLECPGKDVSSLRCMGEFACGAIAGIASGGIVGNALTGGKAAEWVGNWASEKFNVNCNAKDSMQTLGSCATEIVWGAIKNIIGSLEFVVDAVKWVGKKLCFWCDDEHEDMSSDQQHLINSSEVLNEAHNANTGRDGKEDSRNIFEKMWDGLKNLFQSMVADPALSNFGCARWEGNRFTDVDSYDFLGLGGATGITDGKKVRCAEPVGSWDCATCRQRAQVLCGIAGFIGGEIITSLVTGKIVATAGKALSGAGKAFVKAGKTLGKGLAAVPGMNRVASLGKGGIQFLKATGSNLMKVSVAGKAVAIGQKFKGKLVSIFDSIKASKLAKKATDFSKVAGTAMRGAKVAGIKASRTLFDSTLLGKGVKGYFNLLDDAFAFGAGGRNGLLAMRTARDSKRLQNSILLAQNEFKEFPQIMDKVAGAGSAFNQTVNKFDSLVKEAKGLKGPAKEAKMQEARKLADEIAGFRKSFDDQYKVAHQQMKAEKARIAKEAAEKAEAERLAQLAKNKKDNVIDLGNGVTLHTNNVSNKKVDIKKKPNFNNVEDAIIVEIDGVPVGNSITPITDPSRLLPAPNSNRVFSDNLQTTFGQFDNPNLRVHYQAENGTELVSPTLTNVRFEDDFIVGTNPMNNNAQVKIPKEKVHTSEIFYATDNAGRARHVTTNKPLSQSAQGFANDIAKTSSTNPNTLLSRFKDLDESDKIGVIANIDQKIQNKVSLTSDEFLTRLSYEPGSGYRGNNKGIAHQDDFIKAFNSNNPAEGRDIIMKSYGNIQSKETIGIRDMAIDMLEHQQTARIPINRSLSTQNTALTTIDNAPNGNTGIILRQDNLPARTDNLPVHSSGHITPNATNNLPVVTYKAKLPKGYGKYIAPGITIADGLVGDAIDGGELPEVVIVAPRRKPSSTDSYNLTVSYSGDIKPIVCSARVNKLKNGEAILDDIGSPVLLPHAEFAANEVEVKWTVTKGTGVGDAACSGSLDMSDNSLVSCTLATGVEQIQASLIHKGETKVSLKCPSDSDINTDPNDDGDPETPYDVPTPAPTDDDDDLADDFFDRQRSPPPSLFQPINIPRRPTGYMHGGWY